MKNMAGTSAGAAGHGQWSVCAGSSSLTSNPRKFSEKIALHTQRQAEDTAAFREVMMDITSTRIQAQRLRQAKSLASYYGGSLPNVNQISKCSTESQQDHLRLDHGQRDHRPIPLGRPSRRHTDSTPYLSFHLSPPSGPSWRRQWSTRSVNEKSQLDQLPVATLNRTNSDSALHTSVKITSNRDSNPAQVLTACSRKSVFLQGNPLFRHPVPLIEETVQEEGRPLKSQKMPSVLPGCETPGNDNFPSPDLSCPLLTAPSLSTSGSLPDLSILRLPSAVSEAIYPEPQSHVTLLNSPISMQHLPGAAAHSSDMTDNLSSSLQTSTSNSLLQSSLSNPNLQTTLSSHSLVECFSSTSLSLSNSSLQSSLSSQSLQSSLSSSSLSNQSVKSAASHCSYSSGIGGSSSSLSCSPHTSGQGMVPRSASSWKRSQHNPLIVPSGGESVWQQPKQLLPSVSPTFCSITQGVPLDTTKVLQEAKPSTYHHSHLQPASHPTMHQSLQHCQPEVWDQSRQNARKQCQHQVLQQSQPKSQPQYTQHSHSKAQPRLLNPHNYISQQQLHEQKQNLQHRQYQQAQYQQTLHQQCQHAQQYLHQQSQQYPVQHTHPPQYQQQYQELNQCWTPQQILHHNQSLQQYQYQGQPEGPPRTFPEQQLVPPATEMASQNEDHQHNLPNIGAQASLGACMHIKELPSKGLQSKMPVHDPRRERTTLYHKGNHSQRDNLLPSEMASASSLDKEFELHNESYVGLHLTPSQAEALSQKLGQLHKVPADVTKMFDSKCQDVEEKMLPVVEHHGHPQNQSLSKEGLNSHSSTNIAVSFPWLDDELTELTDSIPEFDLEPFALED